MVPLDFWKPDVEIENLNLSRIKLNNKKGPKDCDGKMTLSKEGCSGCFSLQKMILSQEPKSNHHCPSSKVALGGCP